MADLPMSEQGKKSGMHDRLEFLLSSFRETQHLHCYWDTTLVCSDGAMKINRFLLCLCLPETASVACHGTEVEEGTCLLFPELSLADLSQRINHTLALFETSPQYVIELFNITEPATKWFQCKFCPFIASHRSNLKQHFDSMHSRLRLRCAQCAYSTSNKRNLRLHQQTVHQGKGFTCDTCQKTLTTLGNLKQHYRRKHDREKFKCEKCDFQGSTASSLKRHVKSLHEGVRYNCPECSHQSADKANLKVHIESRHLGLSYHCELCDFQASTRGHLATHRKTRHT